MRLKMGSSLNKKVLYEIYDKIKSITQTNLCIFGVTYTTNNPQIYIKDVIDAWTPVYNYHLMILSYFLNILTPLSYILLLTTVKFYNTQLRNGQNCKFVRPHTFKK